MGPKIYIRERTASLINDTGEAEYLQVEHWNKSPNFLPYIKINSKWVKVLNVRSKTLNLLEKIKEEALQDNGTGNDFLDRTPIVQ
jgi:hypothetical protein